MGRFAIQNKFSHRSPQNVPCICSKVRKILTLLGTPTRKMQLLSENALCPPAKDTGPASAWWYLEQVVKKKGSVDTCGHHKCDHSL